MGCPNTVLEIMASGTPLVATRVGGIAAVATDGQTARLVPERDAAALAVAIAGLLRRPSLGAEIGQQARETVCREYSWARVAESVRGDLRARRARRGRHTLMLMWHALAVPLLAYLPGALIFRLPVGERSRRAALPAEERVFWSILLSLALSSFTALGLAAAGLYQFDRLLWINGGVSLLILALVRGRLRLGSSAPYPTWTALVPMGLVVAGSWLNFFVPPSEYIMGGKDPGIYMNEGIQIAQRGTLVITDEVARSVPPPFRDLFFRRGDDPSYYSNRFMGFFLLDPGTGAVVGQFPHLYPVWIAIAYGVDGLSGARSVPGVWAVLGLLAVYFAGARIMGRAAAAAGAGLLAVHVVQIWYARYPNAEIVMQPLVFAGLLAYARAAARSRIASLRPWPRCCSCCASSRT